MNISKAKPDDAEALVNLFNQLEDETDFMLFEPGERNITVEEQAKKLESWEAASSGVVFITSIGREIVGFVVGVGGTANRNRHSLHIAIGILQAFCGQGIGASLMQGLESWAIEHSFHRLTDGHGPQQSCNSAIQETWLRRRGYKTPCIAR